MSELNKRPFENEMIFQTSRSSGPGGQHVNKTETRVELKFHVDGSEILSQAEKERIHQKLKNRISREGYLIISVQENKSQLQNKQLAQQRFYGLLEQALKKRKKRIPTKPTATARQKRIEEKKKISGKKNLRQKPGIE